MPTESISTQKEELKEIIIQNAYFREKIILSSGKESDYYIDARLITLTPKGATLTASLMLDMVKDESIDAIGGPTLGADPMIGALSVISLQNNRPLNTFIIRKEAKAHGKGKQIEGPVLKSGMRVVVVDDVATTGKAFLHSLDVLQSMDIEVVKCVAIVDREEGATEAVAQKGSELISIFQASEIHQP